MIIAICENRAWELKLIEDMVAAFLEKRKIHGKVYRYQSGIRFLQDAAKIMYDIALIEIHMPELSGLLAAKKLKRLNPGCSVIFLAGNRAYAAEAYEIGAVHYIIRPVTQDRLEAAIDRCGVMQQQKTVYEQGKMLEIIVNREMLLLNQDCICYVEANDKMIKIHASTGEYHAWMSLSNLMGKLDQERFLKLQRSYLTHMDYIVEIRGEYCALKDGTQVQISRGNRAEIRAKYRKHLALRVQQGNLYTDFTAVL